MGQTLGTQNGSLPGMENLLSMARDRSEAGRALLVNAVRDLFVDGEQEYSGRESVLMTDILRRLIGDVETEVRKALAERLCQIATVPLDLVIELARDEISVARSVLQNSPVLHDPDLVELVRHRAREHQLTIATRKEIGGSVSEALVETGDIGVITTLLDNASAEISVLTLEYLVEQSKRIDAFQQPLLNRGELTADLATKMYGWVSAELRKHILRQFKIDKEALDGAISDVDAGRTTKRLGQPGGKASELVDRLSRSDMLSAQNLIQVLREGEIPLFEVMFARFTGLEINLVKKVIYELGGKSLAVVCKASHIQKPDFASIFLLSRQARPGDKMVEPGELSRSLECYDHIGAAKAERLLKEWRQQPDHNEAILDLQISRSG